MTDGAGRTTRHCYLPGGRLEKTVYPDGRQMLYEHDGLGRISRKTDGQGYSLLYSYDAVGRVQCITSSAGQVKSCVYDALCIYPREQRAKCLLKRCRASPDICVITSGG